MNNTPVVLFDQTKNGHLDGRARARVRNQIREDGFRDAAKDTVRDSALNKQKFDNLVENSERILFKTRAVFPFSLFPDELTIDQIKVNIIFKEFFASERIQCIYIKNITDVFVDTGPFLATLRIIDQGYTDNTVDIGFLGKSAAMQARRIIQGLIVAHRQEVDISSIHDDDLVIKLEKLGNA